MPVNLALPLAQNIASIAGVELGTARAGIRSKGERDDVLVMRIVGEAGAQAVAAGVFTRNRFCAAPVIVCREHLTATKGQMRGLYINAGNANAGTGKSGLADARSACQTVADLIDCAPNQVLPMSTGVILESLPMDKLNAALPKAVGALGASAEHWLKAANAIMTTDTQPKITSRLGEAAGKAFAITGIAKGAGMIRPNMGTMLSVLATDAAVEPELLAQWTREAADQSFNRITVDGDTSTNDSFVVFASAAGPVKIDSADSPGAQAFRDALFDTARELAQAIIRDGEGATKFISIQVEQAANMDEACAVAYAIAHSPLVKTAFFASDPNLGRLLCAIGYADVPDLDVDRVELLLDDVLVASQGGRHPAYREEDGQRVLSKAEMTVTVRLGRGTIATTVWTCDLSHDYVSINADYRS